MIEKYVKENGHAFTHLDIEGIRDLAGEFDGRIDTALEALLDCPDDMPQAKHVVIQASIDTIKKLYGDLACEFYEYVYGYVCLDLLNRNLEYKNIGLSVEKNEEGD